MKKSLFTLAALATIMASCTSDDLLVDNNAVNTETTKETAIGFSTFSNKATRAAENSTEEGTDGLNIHHGNFAVWGYKDVQDAYVFGTGTTAGQLVSYNTTGTKWEYSPVRFWDKNSNSYEFYAAAPATTSAPLWTLNQNGVTTQNDDYFTLSDVTLKDATLESTTYVESMKEDLGMNVQNATHANSGNVDYMIASTKHVGLADYGTVDLLFNHILSRLNVTVKKSSNLNSIGEDGNVKIVKLEVHNMASKGSFDEHTVPTYGTLANGSVERWTLATNNQVTYTACVASATNITTSPIYVLQSLVMPQVAAYEAITRDGAAIKAANATELAAFKPYMYVEYEIGSKYKTVTADAQTTFDNTYYTKNADGTYQACSNSTTFDANETYYKYNGEPETFKAYYNLSTIFGGTYKEKAVAVDDAVSGLYKRTGDSRDTYAYVACGATEKAVAGTTYYDFVGTNVAFNEGWQNTINLTIDAATINFTASTYKWEDNESNTNSYTVK